MQPADQRASMPEEPPDWPREPLLTYNGLALDRAAGRRADDAWLRGVARRPGSRLLALWRDKCLVDASGLAPVTIPMAGAGALQAWPYPSGIMVGFLARAASDAISVDGDELVEARWFTRAALAAHRAARPRTHGDSIGTHLLDAWLAAGD